MKTINYTTLLAVLLTTAASCSSNEKEYDATGTFETTEVVVSAQSTGLLEKFQLQEGQNIAAGAQIGQIDSEQLRLQKQQLETTRTSIEANRRQLSLSRDATDSRKLNLENQLASIRQQISNARNEQQRFAELVRDGAVPRKQLDDINYQISVLEKQLEATREQLAATNASLSRQAESVGAQMDGLEAQQRGISVQQSQLDEKIGDTYITAPISGTILEKYVEQGEFVSVGKPLFKIADTNHMVLRAYITSAQLQNVKVGQKVKVFANYGNGQRKEYAGTVSWISSQSEFTPKSIVTDDERADLVYAVKINVENDGFIKIGMYGEVKVH